MNQFNMELSSHSRLSRPLFAGANQHHFTPRNVSGNGPSGSGGIGAHHNYTSAAFLPPPEYTTSNPNRCPPNSNDTLFGSRPFVTPSAEEAAATAAECQRMRMPSNSSSILLAQSGAERRMAQAAVVVGSTTTTASAAAMAGRRVNILGGNGGGGGRCNSSDSAEVEDGRNGGEIVSSFTLSIYFKYLGWDFVLNQMFIIFNVAKKL